MKATKQEKTIVEKLWVWFVCVPLIGGTPAGIAVALLTRKTAPLTSSENVGTIILIVSWSIALAVFDYLSTMSDIRAHFVHETDLDRDAALRVDNCIRRRQRIAEYTGYLKAMGLAATLVAALWVFGVEPQKQRESTCASTTSVDLAGKWELTIAPDGLPKTPPASKPQSSKGMGKIEQIAGQPFFSFMATFGAITPAGKIPPDLNHPKWDIKSKIAGITKEREVFLVYENERGEKGVFEGTLSEDHPTEFHVVYRDEWGLDRNDDPTGTIDFRRM